MRARWTVLVALVLGGAPALALGVAATPALAAPSDVAATHAYIQANYALAQAGVARIHPVEARIRRYNGELASTCPHVGLGSPPVGASQPMSYEVAVALWSIAYGANAGPIHTFAKAIAHLKWSNHAITRRAALYARSLVEFATLHMPNLCEDVRTWKASGFQTIAASVSALDAHEQNIELEALPAALLAPYERGGDASTLERTTKLEIKLEEEEFLVGQGDWIEVLETLGLPQ
jgi:hypothetical protein